MTLLGERRKPDQSFTNDNLVWDIIIVYIQQVVRNRGQEKGIAKAGGW